MNIYKIHGYYVCSTYISIKTSVLLLVQFFLIDREKLHLPTFIALNWQRGEHYNWENMSPLVKKETKAVPEASLPAVIDLWPSDETRTCISPGGLCEEATF